MARRTLLSEGCRVRRRSMHPGKRNCNASRHGAATISEPACSTANGARRRRRSSCGRCMSVRPDGQYKTESSPSSCAGREHQRTSGSTTTCSLLHASTRLMELQSSAAPLQSRFWPSELESPDRNCPENTLASREAASRATPTPVEVVMRRDVVPLHEPAAGTAYGVEARRRRRLQCGRCTSVGPAGQRKTGSAPRSCVGRQHSGRAGSSKKAGCRGALRQQAAAQAIRVR